MNNLPDNLDDLKPVALTDILLIEILKELRLQRPLKRPHRKLVESGRLGARSLGDDHTCNHTEPTEAEKAVIEDGLAWFDDHAKADLELVETEPIVTLPDITLPDGQE